MSEQLYTDFRFQHGQTFEVGRDAEVQETVMIETDFSWQCADGDNEKQLFLKMTNQLQSEGVAMTRDVFAAIKATVDFTKTISEKGRTYCRVDMMVTCLELALTAQLICLSDVTPVCTDNGSVAQLLALPACTNNAQIQPNDARRRVCLRSPPDLDVPLQRVTEALLSTSARVRADTDGGAGGSCGNRGE